jgi:uncharacterized DUF497 family protein
MYGKFAVVTFEWDSDKDRANQSKHGVSFEEAQLAFADPKRVIAIDHKHSDDREQRFFCFGKTDRGVITVRFTLRGENIRIFGAGLWSEGKQVYEKQNKVS